ncbi:hypothetical protein [Roseateles sp.]|uniref:hypothetical protein n=1 Tax=Roseateles sp. TaxID=1971397 RepID=UPI0039EC7E8D
MSHTFSDRAPQPKSYVGIGLVVALHVAGIWALSAGLIKAPPRPPEVATFKPLPPDVVTDPPPPQRHPEKPTLRDPQVPLVQPPIFDVFPPQEAPTGGITTARGEPMPSTPGPATPSVALPQQSIDRTQVQLPGAVCSVMPRPEVPAVNWSGEAVLQVIATVRGGRVVGTDLRVTQGAMDGKTRRSLQRSVESALAGYQCQGDAMFQQEFAFRID